MTTACNQELEALCRRQVYDLVECPQGHKVIKNHWVFNIKTDGQKKACLVAKGLSQVEDLDYDQIFSPIIRFESVCLILAMAALEGWVLTGLDVQNAYLYSKLDKEIVRKLDLSQLCSLNFYFFVFLHNFLLCFPLLTYSQSFLFLSADHPRHSKQRRSQISILLVQGRV